MCGVTVPESTHRRRMPASKPLLTICQALVSQRTVRLEPLRPYAREAHLHLAGVSRIGGQQQAHRVFWRPAAPTSYFFRQYAHERARVVYHKSLGREDAFLVDVPQGAGEKVVALVGHVALKRFYEICWKELGCLSVDFHVAMPGGLCAIFPHYGPERHICQNWSMAWKLTKE